MISPDPATRPAVSSADRWCAFLRKDSSFFNKPVTPPSAHRNRIPFTVNSESRSGIPLTNLSDCRGSPFVNSPYGSGVLSANSFGAADGPVDSGESARKSTGERYRRFFRLSSMALLILTVPPVVIWDLAVRDVQPMNNREPLNTIGVSVYLYYSRRRIAKF